MKKINENQGNLNGEVMICGKKISTRLRLSTLISLRNELISKLEDNIDETLGEDIKKEIAILDNFINMKISKDAEKTAAKSKPKKQPKEKSEKELEKEKIKKRLKIKPSDIATKATEEDLDRAKNVKYKSDDGTVVINDIIGLQDVSKEIMKASVNLDDKQIRFVVDSYYQAQKIRIATENQVRALIQGKDGEGNDHTMMEWLLASYRNIENSAMKALNTYADSNPVTQWMTSIKGIGPIIAASLYAYLDVEGVNYAGHFWSYAGLNDNNNPWLGTERSRDLVNEIFKIRAIKNKTFKQVLNDKDIKELSTIASNLKFDEDAVKNQILDMDICVEEICERAHSIANDELLSFKQINDRYVPKDEEEAMEELLSIEERVAKGDVQNPTIGHINVDVPFGISDFVDFVFSLSDNNIVTSTTLLMLVQKLKGRRKYNALLKHSTVVKEDSKYYGLVTKESLIKYLSKPPYNTKLKVLMWKIGESFMKVSKRGSLYGELYAERKAEETRKNSEGAYWEQAALILKTKNFDKKTEAYKWYSQGMLPPAHIEQRCKRYAVKIFLSHVFECMYCYKNGKMPVSPYPINRLGHVDYIEPEVAYDKFVYYKK